MSSDAQWVEDVRRWVAAQERAKEGGASSERADAFADELGYEAADPVLQARHWPDAREVLRAPPPDDAAG